MSRIELRTSPSARARLNAARQWLGERAADEQIVVIAPTLAAGRDLVRTSLPVTGAMFGWRASTLDLLALQLALCELAERGLAPLAGAGREAIVAGVLAERAAAGHLGRFAAVAAAPALPRALSRSLSELALTLVTGDALAARDPALAGIAVATRDRLAELALADRPHILALASAAIASGVGHPLLGCPTLLVDIAPGSRAEAALIAALASAASGLLCVAPPHDERALSLLSRAFDSQPVAIADAAGRSSLERVQRDLFQEVSSRAKLDDSVAILSAPGETRESVEIARRVLSLAERGVAFDRIAILVRAPGPYRAPLLEALRRAGIPAHVCAGVRRPDPSGRALLALLQCTAERLSARGFAEYLSLSVVPDLPGSGAPPEPLAAPERFAPPEEYAAHAAVDELIDLALARESPAGAPVDDMAAAVEGTLRAPRRWERLIVDAAVIGGIDRWQRRLDGLRAQLEAERARAATPDEPAAVHADRQLADLANLRAFALPLLADLAALPDRATWAVWLDQLSALATRAIREPARVLQVLGELAPMADSGPVALDEVFRLLSGRLRDVVDRAGADRSGKVFVATIDEARGMSFAAVFVPGLAENIFPRKVTEDPIVLDRERALLSEDLPTNADRLAGERSALHVAVGAAEQALVLSYPRLDSELARPRVPSFYGLEVLRAAIGEPAGFRALADRASSEADARMAWPAARDPTDAIDDAEYDLATLEQLLSSPPGTARGAARYLLEANPHLARAMRFRALRWSSSGWTSADGLVTSMDAARRALAAHHFDQRSYSPTALQQFAACPYRFYLHAVLRLEPRRAPAPVEEIGPLERGSLIHAAQYRVLGELRARGELPLGQDTLPAARDRLDAIVDDLAAEYADELAPAIARVWEDGIAAIRRDLRSWLTRLASDPRWLPRHFELGFGLRDQTSRDPASRAEPVPLACGLQLRGSIDLVEDSGSALRATDHKTGRAGPGSLIVGGGETLQPVLYALALEGMFPDRAVESGRLYFCTERGGFAQTVVPLDSEARESVDRIAQVIGQAIDKAFLPAAPRERACQWCDYRPICGPYEERRTARKPRQRIEALRQIRRLR